MRRHEVWLAVGVNATVGVALAYGVLHAYVLGSDAPLEWGQFAIVIIVVLLGLGLSGLAFLMWLKRS